MARTDIDLDEELLDRVMKRYGLRTRKEAVDLALRRLAGPALDASFRQSLEGIGWDGGLEALRAGAPPVLP